MENFKRIERIEGCDVGWHNSNIDPVNREGCIGKGGINKSFTLEMVMNLAFKHPEKPNIIIKAGKNAKWYLKKIKPTDINQAMQSQKWRNTSLYTMYVIEWL